LLVWRKFASELARAAKRGDITGPALHCSGDATTVNRPA
jgi:hypothetical protein